MSLISLKRVPLILCEVCVNYNKELNECYRACTKGTLTKYILYYSYNHLGKDYLGSYVVHTSLHKCHTLAFLSAIIVKARCLEGAADFFDL